MPASKKKFIAIENCAKQFHQDYDKLSVKENGHHLLVDWILKTSMFPEFFPRQQDREAPGKRI
jgi:hypothetical protein